VYALHYHMRRVSLFLPEALLEGLAELKREHGTPQAESIRRAVTEYLARLRLRPCGFASLDRILDDAPLTRGRS
jgi:Ribbon-helix-helix protein, copG family